MAKLFRYSLTFIAVILFMGCCSDDYYVKRCNLYISVIYLSDGNTKILIGRSRNEMNDSFIIKGRTVETDLFRIFIEKPDSKDIYILDPTDQIMDLKNKDFRFHVVSEYSRYGPDGTVWLDSSMISDKNTTLKLSDWLQGFYVCVGDSIIGDAKKLR